MSSRRSTSRRNCTKALRRHRNRARLFETLEPRMMLNADWHNRSSPLDVNSDWMLTPMDALLVVNRLNSGVSKELPVRSNSLDFYYDVNGDQLSSPIDVLLIINQLNQNGSRVHVPAYSEGESGTSPAGFISISMAKLPGELGQSVAVSASIDIGRKEFNEMGLFVVDGPDGSVHGILPSSPDYAAAVFQSSQRQVLYSRASVSATQRELVFPAGQYISLYVLQQYSSNGKATDHLRARESASGGMQIGWDEQVSVLPDWPIVGDRGYDDVTVEVEFGEPIDGNAQPVIAAIANQTIDELSELSIQLTATDSDSATGELRWSKTSGPAGLQVNSQTGLLTWTPSETDGPGQFEVTVSVVDGALSDSQTFTVMVNEVNVAPVIASIGEQVVEVGTALSITAVATDADLPSNALRYSFEASPAGATIDSQSGLIRWSPSVAGEAAFVVRVTDAGGLYATTSFRVTTGVVAGDNSLLTEGTAFKTELSRVLTLPNDTSALLVTFEIPKFDFSSKNTIRDAFEIEVTDLDGNPLTFPYAPNRDAVYNWSEGLEALFGVGVATTTNPAGQASSATINLSGLAAGSRVRVSARLVNNDSDVATSVVIRGFEIVDAPTSRPSGVPGLVSPSFGASSIPLSDLSELSASFLTSYGRTTLAANNTDLVTQLTVTNNSRDTIVGRIVVAIGNMSEPDAQVLKPDGFLQDGRPYIDLSRNLIDGVLEPGESLTSHEIRFRNLSGQRFTYQLSILGMQNRAPSGFSTFP
ncbi:MAG: putative Ig domain-containing protein, partial [Aureliella sp.]